MASRTGSSARIRIGAQRIGSKTGTASQRGSIRAGRASADAIIKNLVRVVEGFKRASPAILVEVLRPTLALSQTRVPFDTGALHASAYLEVRRLRVNSIAEIGYGRRNPPGFKDAQGKARRPREYAAEVHENPMGYRFRPPGQPKFLETAIREDSANYPSRIRDLYAGLIK